MCVKRKYGHKESSCKRFAVKVTLKKEMRSLITTRKIRQKLKRRKVNENSKIGETENVHLRRNDVSVKRERERERVTSHPNRTDKEMGE